MSPTAARHAIIADMVLLAVSVGMLVILSTAVGILVYVMFPHRKKRPRYGRQAVARLARLAERIRPHGPVPVHGLWVDPDRDVQLRGRLDTVEKVVTVGLTRRGMPVRET